MNRKILTLLFISFVSVCLVIGFLGRIAIAQDSGPTRSAQAYEQERSCIGGMCFYTGRQYTSQYDLMRGEIYPNVTFQYAAPDYSRMFNPFAPATEYSYEGSAIGGIFSGPMMRFPVSPMSYMLGTIGAPQAQMYQSQGLFTGSTSFTSLYPGFGFQGAGFMLGPFSMLGAGGWGSPFYGLSGGLPGLAGGLPGLAGGLPGLAGGSTGSYPTRIY